MGWEHRGSNGPYYTRSRKVNGRVVREYVGGGFVGGTAAMTDAEARAEKAAELAAQRAANTELDQAEQILTDFCDAVDSMAQAALYLAGYHRHKHGEWRRRREEGSK